MNIRQRILYRRKVRAIVCAIPKQVRDQLTVEELRDYVADRLVDEDPTLLADPAFDWEGLLDFIERILPLILKILFS